MLKSLLKSRAGHIGRRAVGAGQGPDAARLVRYDGRVTDQAAMRWMSR